MTFIITSLCVRDGGCVTVCPVECIVPGKPQGQYPLYYIDPETCIDCGACVRECPVLAIYPEDEVPTAFKAKGGERISMPEGTPGFEESYDLLDFNSQPIHLTNTRELKGGELVDLTPDIKFNYDFFSSGPGYEAINTL